MTETYWADMPDGRIHAARNLNDGNPAGTWELLSWDPHDDRDTAGALAAYQIERHHTLEDCQNALAQREALL